MLDFVGLWHNTVIINFSIFILKWTFHSHYVHYSDYFSLFIYMQLKWRKWKWQNSKKCDVSINFNFNYKMKLSTFRWLVDNSMTSDFQNLNPPYESHFQFSLFHASIDFSINFIIYHRIEISLQNSNFFWDFIKIKSQMIWRGKKWKKNLNKIWTLR